MSPSLRRLAWAATIAPVLVAACAAVTVSSYTWRGAEFTRYHTYAWSTTDPGSTGDPRLDHNPFFDERVRAAVDAGLARRGFEKKVSAAQPDLLVHYHASVTQEIQITGLERRYGYADPDRPRAEVYEPGTLLIDFMDAPTGTLVWRGWAKTNMDGVIDNQEWLEKTIDDSVERILARLPRAMRVAN